MTTSLSQLSVQKGKGGPPPVNLEWPQDRIATLQRLVEVEQLTSDETAKRMGLTRNMVIGKCRRMGFIFAGSYDQGAARVAAGERRAAKEARALVIKKNRYVASGLNMTMASKAGASAPVPPQTGPVADSRHVTLVELTRTCCRWPLDGEPMNFCGARAIDAKPYCTGHDAAAYYRPKTSASNFARGLRRFHT